MPAPSEEDTDLLAETYGMDVVFTEQHTGATSIYYVDSDLDGFNGYATGPSCTPHVVLRSSADAQTLAHELGHTYGLEHFEDDGPTNLMSIADPNNRGFELRDEQIDRVRLESWRMETKCN